MYRKRFLRIIICRCRNDNIICTVKSFYWVKCSFEFNSLVAKYSCNSASTIGVSLRFNISTFSGMISRGLPLHCVELTTHHWKGLHSLYQQLQFSFICLSSYRNLYTIWQNALTLLVRLCRFKAKICF